MMDDLYPTISVMMPCCNNARYIDAAVESVLSQQIDVPLELLIIDDASTDDSVDRIRAIDDPRIRLIRNRSNAGISRVRNQLLAAAHGRFLTSLDGDDVYVDPRKLDREWELLHRCPHPERTIVYSDVRWIDGDGATMLQSSAIAPPMEGILYQAILDRRVMIPRDFLLSAELARSVGGFDVDLPIYEDWDYKLRLAQKAVFRYTGAVGIGYRRHGSGLSAAAAPLHQTCQAVIRKKHGGEGSDGDPMRLLSLAGRLHGILTRNRLQDRKAA
ncbi:UDP-Glc:alpha-D-GlcNAc-diphosphoundecaprenol beta-1,3-glucosyltransferase WfgD [Stieleria neptunia]|uniref:UDP-Glc:alpha-D-GlcNAc-diphosphoundecaprenol beta-1,3-glucosyltransferase WfgD n=1 Tax=Stieleria neptunia TaxID=2527979 RepID=A0A518HHQ6_9BACT|nr:glycosyltransferase [Stieleria neptunia]QDV40339.1 UDP-Glc:alpha-D-GlcNAc-diphosphoundecaprenol beta-1,3-glucosyltransferase WfgD [Stieleria neptunia]